MEKMRLYQVGVVIGWLYLYCYLTLLVSGQTHITHPGEVRALKSVYGKLGDPFGKLKNWRKKDPCTSNWTGVICIMDQKNDGYLHVVELRLPNLNLTGQLDPQLGQLSNLTILNFMWNKLSGNVPKEIGNISTLRLLLLTANRLSGPLPDELGYLPNLQRLQLDLNDISGPIPKSFANLIKLQHVHMNNNSISGQIPKELSVLPECVHFLFDNNNLSGFLPPEFSNMPKLRILQLDNNNFEGSQIPNSYVNMTKLLKLSLRNCNLQGSIPDFSSIPKLLYLDLSSNQLTGSIPTNKLSHRITTIDLSKNMLGGTIPSNFSGLPDLQKLFLEDNKFTGNISSAIWEQMVFKRDAKLTVNLKNNLLSAISGIIDPPPNVTIEIQGNPVCTRAKELNIVQYCELHVGDDEDEIVPKNSSNECPSYVCPTSFFFEYVLGSPECFCAAPITVGILLRSPSISDIKPYIDVFQSYITSNLQMDLYQLAVASFEWQEGPRLSIYAKLFPVFAKTNTSNTFNTSEIQRIRDQLATLSIPPNDTFGPYDLIDFFLYGPYKDVVLKPLSSGMKKGLLVGIILGAIACGATALFIIAFILHRKFPRFGRNIVKAKSVPKRSLINGGVKQFSFVELEAATNSFDVSCEIGHGGYGKVYKGILGDGTVVAVKRARHVSGQGEHEFFTEIELLSRLHHRNLVSLLGYCDEQGEQMLVYEFVTKGSLHGLLHGNRFQNSLSYAVRVNIALDSAKGILYLHTEAHPPVIHRDIKANNILLDSRFNAKVADFGISRLAPTLDTKGSEPPHVLTNVQGTYGYLDPQYVLTHKLTEKSDVYSLGVVFLELLTGMLPIFRNKHIVNEVVLACESGRMFSVVDRNMGSYTTESIKRFMDLALKCCQDETNARPSMLEIVRELENICSMEHEYDDSTTSESNITYIQMANLGATSRDVRNNTTVSSHFRGSDLISGVIPTINPR